MLPAQTLCLSHAVRERCPTFIAATGANPVAQYPEQKPGWSVKFPSIPGNIIQRRPSGCSPIGGTIGAQSFVYFNDGFGHWALCLYSDPNCQYLVDDIEGYGDGTTRRARLSGSIQSFEVIGSDESC